MKLLSVSLLALIFSISSRAQQIILNESFNSGIPSNWSIIDGDQFTVHPSVAEFQPAWIGLIDPFNVENKIAGSTSYFEPEGKAYRFLVTPQLNLGSYGNILSWRSMSHDPSFPDWIMVLVSKTGNSLADFTDTLFRLNNEFPYWTERSINLSDSGLVDMNVYLAFVNHTNQGFKLYVDDIKVEINNPLGTQSLAFDQIRVYPNPIYGGSVQLKCELSVQQLSLLDLNGRMVKKLNPDSKTISLEGLQSGIYFLQVQTSKGIQTLRLQKL